MRGRAGFLACGVFLLVFSSCLSVAASRSGPESTGTDPILKVGGLDEMKTRNPLPAIAQDLWTRAVLDRIYDTPMLRNATTEAPIAYIAKGVDVDEDGVFEAGEYDVWQERANATTPLAITVYYDFNGVRWGNGTQMDVWDLLFAYHLNAMHPVWNSALRVLFAGGPDASYDAGGRKLNDSLAAKNWQGEGSLPGDPVLRVALTFQLNEPWVLFPRTLAPKLLPMAEWSRTGNGHHASTDFGCAIWLPPTVADQRGLRECGTTDTTRWGTGIAATDVVPGSHPYDYSAAERWIMQDADVIGSGPFKGLTWLPSIEADVVRNDGYYTGVDTINGMVYDPVLPTRIHKPFIGGIRFLVYRTTQLDVLALESGDIDYVNWNIPPEFELEMVQHLEIARTSNAEPGFTYLVYNMRKEPWGYKNGDPAQGDIGYPFRRAMSYVADKHSIVQNLLQNSGVVGDGVVSRTNTYWYDPSTPASSYDLNQTTTILDSPAARAVGISAKPPGTCSQSTPSGCRSLGRLGQNYFEVIAPQADYDPIRASVCVMIADAMRQVGINVGCRPTAFGQLRNLVNAHTFDMGILDWGFDTTDPDYLFDLFHSSNGPSGLNYPGFDNSTLDRVIESSRTELNRTNRRADIFTVQQIVGETRPYEPLYYRVRIEAYRQDHFVNWTFSAGSLWNPWSLLGIHPPGSHTITVTTSPGGLAVVVGGTTQTAPASVTCTAGETVAVNVVSPQVVGASRYTFASWSDGGAPSHAIPCTGDATVTATFTGEHYMTVQTAPPGLEVTVDGITAPAPVSRWCPEGSTIALAVPSPQGSGDTRRMFASWSDGGNAAHYVSCTAPATITATFATEFRITVGSDPIGVPLTLNGTAGTPDGIWCEQGSTVSVGAPAETSPGGRPYGFVRWSDGGAREHEVICSSPSQVTATFEEVPSLDASDFVLIGIGALAAAVTVVLALVWRRKKKLRAP